MSWKLVSEFMLTDVQIAILTCKLNRPGIAGGTNFCEGRAMTSTTTNKFYAQLARAVRMILDTPSSIPLAARL